MSKIVDGIAALLRKPKKGFVPQKISSMNGQWIGTYEGMNSGRMVIDLDDMGAYYKGTVCLYDSNANLPSSMGVIVTPDKAIRQKVTVDPIWVIHPDNGNPVDWDDELAKRFPLVEKMTRSAEAEFSLDGDDLKIEWTTDIGTSGKAILPRSQAEMKSEYVPQIEIQTWEDFKSFVHSLDHRRYIFRGQSSQWKLRTSFHRSGRADLRRYNFEDIKELYRHLSSRTKQLFFIDIPDHRGAFLNLIQHHGYPTPLLDWTYSPYVAAFFAFNEIRSQPDQSNQKVRLFIFDKKEWLTLRQWNGVVEHNPHFSLIEFIALENDRLIPQQSISSITNIDDIEQHIRRIEYEGKKEYLRVVDIPYSERNKVMRELSAMGITAGSLFPGFDGMCAELRERNFPR